MARILLADDDASMRDLVKRALEADGHAVDVTQDGLEALERLTGAGGNADVLVTDVNMPGLDGISLAQRAIIIKPALRILLMSGFTEELERAKSIKAVRLGVLPKPFTLEQIRGALKALIA